MASVPLFIHSPVSDSLLQALPFIDESQVFKFFTLKIDQELFPLLLDARPCVAIFSITEPEESRQICQLLEGFRDYRLSHGYPARDPTLRIMLAAEQRAVAIERWHDLSIHEFIIAPILPRALAYKVNRHHQRAVASEVPEPELEKEEDDIIVIRAGAAGSKVSDSTAFQVVDIPLDPTEESARRFKVLELKNTNEEEATRKLSVVASIPELRQNEGEWKPASDSENPDGSWGWSWHPPKDKEMKVSWSYKGDRPVYDRKHGGWKLTGKDPELVRRDEKGRETKMISLEQTGTRKEVVIDEHIDVQQVSERSLRPHYSTSAKNRPREWKSSLEQSESSPPFHDKSDDAPGKGKSQSTQERRISDELKAREIQRRVSQGADEDSANPGLPSDTASFKSESIKAGSRTLILEPERRRDWQNLSGTSEGKDPGKSAMRGEESSPAPSSQSKTFDAPAPPGPRDSKQTGEASRSGIKTASDKSRAESSSADSPEPDSREQTQDESAQQDESESQSSKLIAQIEAALLGRATESADSKDVHENDGEEKHPLFTTGVTVGTGSKLVLQSASKGVKPETDLQLNSQNDSSPSEISAKHGQQESQDSNMNLRISKPEPKHQPRVLKSSDEETNTWSMQNLDEVSKKSRLRPEQETAADETSRTDDLRPDDAATDRGAHLPMDENEKARLLKKVYEELNLSNPTSEKPEGSFISKLIDRIIQLLRGNP